MNKSTTAPREMVLFTTDFFSEYELYKTADADGLIEEAKRAYIDGATIDTVKHVLIGCQDDFTADIARKLADKIIYVEIFETSDNGKAVTIIQ